MLLMRVVVTSCYMLINSRAHNMDFKVILKSLILDWEADVRMCAGMGWGVCSATVLTQSGGPAVTSTDMLTNRSVSGFPAWGLQAALSSGKC